VAATKTPNEAVNGHPWKLAFVLSVKFAPSYPCGHKVRTRGLIFPEQLELGFVQNYRLQTMYC
jgi:hypothetical protein